LIYGDPDRFYKIVDPSYKADDDEGPSEADLNGEIVGFSIANISYEGDQCSFILFRNWTSNFKYQFA